MLTRKTRKARPRTKAPAVSIWFMQLEAQPLGVGVHPPRHAVEPDEVHREEGQVEADEHQPEVQLAEPLVQHPAEHLGPPVVGAGGQAEDAAAEQHVMEVGDHEVGVGLLQVGRRRGVHDARQAADDEHGDEADGEQHRRPKLQRSAPHRADPVEDLHPGRDRDQHGGERRRTCPPAGPCRWRTCGGSTRRSRGRR